MNSDDLELIRDVMQALMQSRAWYHIVTADPELAAADAELEALLDQVPPDLRGWLESAVNHDLACLSDAAVRYGLRAARLLPATL